MAILSTLYLVCCEVIFAFMCGFLSHMMFADQRSERVILLGVFLMVTAVVNLIGIGGLIAKARWAWAWSFCIGVIVVMCGAGVIVMGILDGIHDPRVVKADPVGWGTAMLIAASLGFGSLALPATRRRLSR